MMRAMIDNQFSREIGGGVAGGATSSLVQASAPRSVKALPLLSLATLGKPFCREFLFYPERSLSRPERAVACVLRGSLAYRGPLEAVLRCDRDTVKRKQDDALRWREPKDLKPTRG